jgi:hypothetical protein
VSKHFFFIVRQSVGSLIMPTASSFAGLLVKSFPPSSAITSPSITISSSGMFSESLYDYSKDATS